MAEIKLKSGRIVYANQGIFGLGEDWEDPDAGVTHGYDGDVPWVKPDLKEVMDMEEGYYLTNDEMREICDIMIDRWTRFRATL